MMTMPQSTVVGYKAFLEELRQMPRKQKTFIMAVDGGGGSGKSFFVRRLQAADPSIAVVHMDDFFLPANQRTGYHEPKTIAADFDWHRLEGQVLKPLAQNEPGYYQRYDWQQDRLAEYHTVPVCDLVVVEGIYTLLLDLRPYYDYAVWVECPYETRLARGLERDGEAARQVWVSDWMPAEERYLNAYQPHKCADLLVDGSGRVSHDPNREFVRIDG
jgi:uridine kinase